MKQGGGGQQGGAQGGDYKEHMSKYSGDYQKYMKQGGGAQGGDYKQYMSKGGDYQKYMKQGGGGGGDQKDEYMKKYAGDYQKYMKQGNQTGDKGQPFIEMYAADYKKYMKNKTDAGGDDKKDETSSLLADTLLADEKVAASPEVLAVDTAAAGATNFPSALLVGIAAVPAGGLAAHFVLKYQKAMASPVAAPDGYVACEA